MDFESIYSEIKKVWSQSSSQKFAQTIEEIFSSGPEPYLLLMMCVQSTKEIYFIKSNTMTAKICFEFEKIIAKDTQGKLLETLTTALQREAFYIATKIKQKILFNTFINCFHLSQNPNLIYPLLLKELEQGKAKEACNFAIKLDLQSKFSAEELLIPLFFDDAIQCIEMFLDSSLPHREPFLIILDKIVGGEIVIGDLIQELSIRRIRGQKSSKIISKLGLRLMKKYEINSKVCPNMMRKQILGGAKYLFYRRYIAKEITQDSFVSFLKDIAEDAPSLRAEILELFIDYYDSALAVSFLKLVDCSDLQLPSQIKEALTKNFMGITKPMESLMIEEDMRDFYTLKIEFSSIRMICTLSEFDSALKVISNSAIIAVDSEWKPSFQTNAKLELALIQIATRNGIFLFDMICLPHIMKDIHWEKLGSIFSNKSIQKLVYGFQGDKDCLSELHSILASHLKSCCSFIDFDERKRVLEDSYPDMFNFKPKNEKGLSELVYLCFGKPLDKKHQFSYWSARPLVKNQIVYAALDAYCLLDIEKYLDNMSQSLNLPNWRTLKKINKSNANSKTKSSSKSNKLQEPSVKKMLPPCSASEFKVVCDNMVQGLGRLLRHCNIDTAILAAIDSYDKCVTFYERERRVILTRGNVYHQLCRHIPESYVYSIISDDPKEQLRDVVAAFNVTVRESDVFVRCAECNSLQFLYVPPEIISQMKSKGKTSCRRRPASQWVAVKGGKINPEQGLTDKNVKIAFEGIHQSVLEKVSVVYICKECGKCYWDGSHYERILKNSLNHVIQPDVPCIPVPPPSSLAASTSHL